jgi:hypothetical protein
MEKINVSLFLNRLEKKPVQTIDLWDWLTKRSPYMDIIDDIRSSDNEERKKYLKSQLPAITPGGVFSERKSDKLIAPTFLICIDIDGKDNPDVDMETLKLNLSKRAYIMYCGLSAGGKGVFCLIKIANYKSHLKHFYALENEFASMGVVIDSSCKDIGRLRFYSYDSNAYINPESEVYTACMELSTIKRSFVTPTCYKRTNNVSNTADTIDMTFEAFLRPMIDETTVMMVHFSSVTHMAIYELIKHVVSLKIDITSIYRDWIFIGCIIASRFDEEGRGLFLEISSFYPNYTPEECNRTYNSFFPIKYHPSTRKLFIIAEKYDIL